MSYRSDAVSAPPGSRLTRGGVWAPARWRGLRSLIALTGALAILCAQQFLTVHALHHLGQTNRAHCEYAPLAAAAGSAVMCAALVLAPPAPMVPEFPAPRLPGGYAATTTPQARAPPPV
ncbi:MAG TPA: hypothetical protein VKB51_10000 [bacterium]|nr:hypothetical protein [bacterium]